MVYHTSAGLRPHAGFSLSPKPCNDDTAKGETSKELPHKLLDEILAQAHRQPGCPTNCAGAFFKTTPSMSRRSEACLHDWQAELRLSAIA